MPACTSNWARLEYGIEEMKSDLALEDFCMKEFIATETTFLRIEVEHYLCEVDQLNEPLIGVQVVRAALGGERA